MNESMIEKLIRQTGNRADSICFLEHEELRTFAKSLELAGLSEFFLTEDASKITEKVELGIVDVVVSDWIMPQERNGIQFLRYIASIDKDVILVLLTGYVLNKEDEEECEKYNINVIKKTSRTSSFLTKLALIVSRSGIRNGNETAIKLEKKAAIVAKTLPMIPGEYIEKDRETQERLKLTLLSIAAPLIEELESVQHSDALMYDLSDEPLTMSEVLTHVKNLTALGCIYITYYIDALRTVDSINKQNQ